MPCDRVNIDQALSSIIEEEAESALQRKAALLQGEVLDMTNRLLPHTFSAKFQVVPRLVDPVGSSPADTSLTPISMTYQADSVSRTLHRSQGDLKYVFVAMKRSAPQHTVATRSLDSTKPTIDIDMDEIKFRASIVDTQVLNYVKHIKWNWDLIGDLVEGPLKNSKRLSEAITGTKFLKRLLSFYRPFKYRFSDTPSTKLNQRYVRVGVSLMRTLLHTSEGIAYLSESKFLRQLGECLAQLDRVCLSFAPLALLKNADQYVPRRAA